MRVAGRGPRARARAATRARRIRVRAVAYVRLRGPHPVLAHLLFLLGCHSDTELGLPLALTFPLSLALAHELAGHLWITFLLAVQMHAGAHPLMIMDAALGRRMRMCE